MLTEKRKTAKIACSAETGKRFIKIIAFLLFLGWGTVVNAAYTRTPADTPNDSYSIRITNPINCGTDNRFLSAYHNENSRVNFEIIAASSTFNQIINIGDDLRYIYLAYDTTVGNGDLFSALYYCCSNDAPGTFDDGGEYGCADIEDSPFVIADCEECEECEECSTSTTPTFLESSENLAIITASSSTGTTFYYVPFVLFLVCIFWLILCVIFFILMFSYGRHIK